MVTIRSDKFELRRVVNGLIGYGKVGMPEVIYTPELKYVDVPSNTVWIINSDKRACEPTHGTLRRIDSNMVTAVARQISRQLNDEIRVNPN